MKTILNLTWSITVALFIGISFTGCDEEEAPAQYQLKKEDIQVTQPEKGFTAEVDQLLKISVTTVSDEGVSYQWLLDGAVIANTKNLEYMVEEAGNYELVLRVSQSITSFDYNYTLIVNFGEVPPTPEGASAYVTQVFDFVPAVGQFTNTMPAYKDGDTQATMNKKVLDALTKKSMISLGGFGGYVVVGFDHTIQNVAGKRDFRVIGNAFYAEGNPDSDAPEGGSCEPGVIMVAYDKNKNGKPDEDEWYEIAGSAHEDATKELWYDKAVKAGNDVKIYRNYEITYYRPEKEPTTDEEMEKYIRWEDNQGKSGYKVKNMFHNQSYFPEWVTGDKVTFKGTCLPQNSIDESGEGTYYVLYKLRYGYADNELNNKDDSAIDIDWAVNSKGQKVHLSGVDFIKIYTGVNQESGWLGECSTDVTSVEDLHILGKDIDTRK